MAKGIEELTKDTFLQYAGMRARVVARATQEQAGDLRRALEEMGKEMRGVVEAHRGSLRSWLSSKSPYIGG